MASHHSRAVIGVIMLMSIGGIGFAAPDTGQQRAPAGDLHEELIAEASPGSDVLVTRSVSSSTGRHLAWIEKAKGKQTVWLDGKQVGGAYEDVKYLAFRGADRRLSFIGRRSTWTLVTNGLEIPGEYTKLTAPDVDAQGRLAIGFCRDKKCGLLLDGRESSLEFEDIGGPDFSPKGDRYVYPGKKNKKWVIVLDGKQFGSDVDSIWMYRWSPDGSRLAVAVGLGGKWTWMVDGQPGPVFDAIGEIAFSRDSQHFAYGGANSRGGFKQKSVVGEMVLDGKRLEPTYVGRGFAGGWTTLLGSVSYMNEGVRSLSPDFHGVSDPEFTVEGALVFAQRLGNGNVVVRVGDRPGPAFDDIVSPILTGREGSRLAYVAKQGDRFVEVRDQKPGPDFEAKGDVSFVAWIHMTATGKLGYEIVCGGKEFKAGRSARALRRIVVDGKAGTEYDALGTACWWSDDDRHYACVVRGAQGDLAGVLLDGIKGPLYDEVVGGSATFHDTAAQFVARRDRRFYLVTMKLS